MAERETDQEIARIQGRLADLEAERASLERWLADLLSVPPLAAPMSTVDAGEATKTSGETGKVTLFRRLFAGRQDVYPLRWENAKTGRSGYAPVCANEWAKGVCGKPQVKCGECPNQAFIPVSDEVIENHLRGKDRMRPRAADFVAGVYPLLADETCLFLAADFDGESWAAERRAAETVLRSSNGQERLILATGRYLGEGFDDPRLDTLFLAMPISWKGTLAQYVGRLHRGHEGKSEVIVYDYADMAVPVLARMAARRQAGYRALGYVLR